MSTGQVLQKKGWQKKGVYDEPRLSEIVSLYKALGFEVRLESLTPGKDKECKECMRGSAHRYRTLYTRKGSEHFKK